MAADPDKPKSRSEEIKRWIDDINTAQKREKSYRTEGRKIMEIYEGEKPEDMPFNILFSNTAILSPALYGNLPRPVVQRRFKDDDPIGKAASEAATRMLSFLLDTNSEEYDDFDAVTKETVLDACLPGRGLAEFCYEGETAQVPVPGQAEPSEQLVHECVYAEHMVWNRFVHGYAKKWQDVPWLAFELYFDKPAAEKQFGAVKAKDLKYVPEGDAEKDEKDSSEKDSNRKVARVYKVWDKGSRRLLFIAQDQDDYLKVEDDPYKLTGFFPCPKPLRLVHKSGNLLPSPLYALYKNQAEELNRLTTRINALIKMCKVRGVFDGTLGDEIKKVLDADDGELIPTDQASTLAREGGLEKHIWLMPLDKVVATIQQLYMSRQQCKAVIYEITGISDIMRGDTQASETLGAQKLKSQYGSLRLKDLQGEVERYVRDCLRIMLEIAAQMFSPETWMKATGLPYLTDEQAMQAQAAMQAAAQQYAMTAAQAQQSGQPAPPPPQPPQLPPKWSDVLGVLKDDLQREYKIDVETNSTIDPSATEQRQNLAEMINAIAQFLNGVGPLVQEGALPLDAAKGILLGIVRQYEMGSEVEDYIRQMQMPAPQQQQPDKSAEIALQGQLQKSELEKQGIAQKAELDKRGYDLGLREADLKNREAAHSADKELFRIQHGAAKDSMKKEHALALNNHKQLTENAVARVQQVAKDIDLKLKTDAQTRATDQAANEKVAATAGAAADQVQSLGGLMKELTKAVQALTQATVAPKEKRIVKNKDGSKSLVEGPAKGGT
jgi:hypothetical protein